MSTQEEKRYSTTDTTLRFVTRKDDITLDDDPDNPRALMSCDHAVTPQSLTAWCRSLLDKGQYKFHCPALIDGSSVQCNEVWPYEEVRRLALLTDAEMQDFEENIARLAATEYCDFKSCPGCQTFVERADLTNLSVSCSVCAFVKKKTFEFCWQCLKEWKGSAPRSDKCDNDGCVNTDLEILRTCTEVKFAQVEGVTGCPSIRACPTCGRKVEHNGKECKNVICPRCQKEFCFVCLKLTPKCLETSSYYIPCTDGVAPRQTSIPTWKRD